MEVWDARDEKGRILGFELLRGEAIPDGVYHLVVDVYTVNEKQEILVTKRAGQKKWPYYWEVTGGSALAGENGYQAAVRELYEETGIKTEERSLLFLYSCFCRHSYYQGFLNFVDNKIKISLRDGETSAYRFLPYAEFPYFIQREDFVASLRERYLQHRKIVDFYINNKKQSI